ncbi:MAG TPA: PadR family transcriptional regulator [Bryobacteraceae bacterium]|jgi:transcriptional regulator|nr:PadR family transcriptional regulator [Bryobacteraceae bacterium]
MRRAPTRPGELLRDTLDMLVLKTLKRGAMHGYAIAEFIEETTEDVLRVEEGALYPALHRLELRGLVAAEWGVSENNRRARYYRLTAAGRKRLSEQAAYWGRMTAAVARIMEA